LITNSPEQKIKELFDKYFYQLVLHSFRFTDDYKQSEEIVQDVFVKVWQNFEQIENISNFNAYLYKAVRNSSLNFIRHIKIRQKYVEDFSNTHIENEKAAEELIIDSEKENQIHNAINKLPENWREAIILSKYDKLKYLEIAQKMNISEKTVEKYISKALQFLRVELSDILLSIILFLKIF
jgi:RNA polymerase sigma-70 factor, ECF subfamily